VPLLEAAHFGALSWARDERYLAPPLPLPIVAAPVPKLSSPSSSTTTASGTATPPAPPSRPSTTPLPFNPHRAYPLAPLPASASSSSSAARNRRNSLSTGFTRTGFSCRRPPPHSLLAATGRFPSRPPAPKPTPPPLPLPLGSAYANALAAQEHQGAVKQVNTSVPANPRMSMRAAGGLKSAASFSFGSSLAHSSGGGGDGADSGPSANSQAGATAAPSLSAPALPPLPAALATAKAMAKKGSGPVQNGGLRDLRTITCGGGFMSASMAEALMALDSTPNRHTCTVSQKQWFLIALFVVQQLVVKSI